MNIKHHLDEATLFSYVAGALGQGAALVTACHLSLCEYCRDRTRQLEAIGGALLENSSLSAVNDNMLLDVLEKLDSGPVADSPPPAVKDSEVPPPLVDYIGDSLDAVAWKRLVAGVWVHDLPAQGEGLTRLLRVSPGKAALPHTHRGSELTQLLRGSFTDEVGRFTPGDVADLDDRITHQPLVDGDQDCICLIATEHPLRYTTLLGRIAQPIFGF